MNRQKVLIVGGSSGIGLAGAKLLIQHGFDVTIAGRSRKKLEEAKAQIDGQVETIVLDMTDEKMISDFFKKTDVIHNLVITASDAAMGNFMDIPVPEVKKFFDGKFWGTYLLTRYAVPKIASGGSITFFSGAASQKASPGFAFGSALNAAIETLGRSLARELAPIRVNTISPGIIQTPIWEKMPAGQIEEAAGFASQYLPAHRLGRPEDVAESILYLIRSEYTTGTTLFVDGGYLLF